MPGFKGKRKWGLILTLYKKNPLRYRLPVSPPRKRAKTSSSTPNLKSPAIRTPSLLKKDSFNFKIFIFFQTGFHTYSAVKKQISIFDMYIPCEASSWTLLHQNRKLSSRISLQNRLFCLCWLPAVYCSCRMFSSHGFGVHSLI